MQPHTHADLAIGDDSEGRRRRNLRDLGVGVLFPAPKGRAERDLAMNTIAPVWDGNETWLVLGGAAVLIPMILAHTGHAYWVFRGKVRPEDGYR